VQLVILPIANISGSKLVAADDQQVLGVSFFGSFREIE
jgi:hypothetical protein